MKARIGCAHVRAGAWFDALSRGARGDQGGRWGGRGGPEDVSEPERDRSVDDLGAGDQVADPALPEIARQRTQRDARFHGADDGQGKKRHGERVRSAEERGQRRQGEDGVPPQASKDSRRPAGVERQHAQTGGAFAERTSGSKE